MSNIILPNRSIVKPRGFYLAEMYRPSENRIIWKEKIFENLVVDVGLAELLTNGLTSTTQYLGLTGTTPTVAAGDTMSSHAGWTEFTGYDEATRELWDFVQTGASATNAASRAEFTITLASQTIGGLFLVNNSTKGGSTGILYSAAPFATGDRTGNQAGDIIRATYIATTADDGV
jgi:hypothetical protein